MKLSKVQEAKAIKAYEVYFDSYINGDVDTIGSMLDENYNQIGSAEAEVFYNKNEAIKFLKDTIDQVAGKTEIRNRSIKVDPIDKFVLVTDLFDIYALMEMEWAFYAKFRASTFMEQKEDGWKFIHQHSSMPDSRTENGENIAIEKIAAENQELREAVKRRTIELENKSRDLEIETSLERVRSVAMSMRKPDDMLDVCQIISEQLESLGVTDIRNIQVAIIDESNKNYLNYQYFTPYSKKVFEITEYEKNPASQAMVTEMQKSANSFFIGDMQDKQLEEFREWRKKHNQFPDPLLDKTSAVFYYFYSIGNGGLGLTTYNAISDSSLDIFKKFHKVFELAYRRFHDIEKAEAQAREAQIEASLERVRAASMAMHKSEQLSETATVMFQQLCSLGQVPDRLGIVIYNEQQQSFESWTTDQSGMQLTKAFNASNKEPTTFSKIYKAWKENKDLLIIDLTDQELKKWLRFVKENMKLPIKESNIKNQRIHYAAFFSHGCLMCTFHKPSEHNFNQLLVRFAKVFDQTYTRFLDLQKAESQAREAQIETALERVRARTMGMQKSEELTETTYLLSEQLKELGEEIDQITIGIIKEDEKIIEAFGTIKEDQFQTLRVPIDEPFVMGEIYKAWKRKKSSIVVEISGEKLLKYNIWRNDFVGKNIYPVDNPKGTWIVNAAIFSKGMLSFSSEKHVSQDTIQLLERFASVFDLTYTRFNDLLKAEAQAREAQIEAALERVRSKTMAMHNSQDVGATVVTLFDEVLKLGLDKSIRVGIGILEGYEGMETWSATSNPDGEVDLKMGMLNMTIHPMLVGLKKAWKSGKTSYSYDYIGDDVFRYYEALNNEPEYPFQADLDLLPENEYHRSFFYSEGILFSFAPNPISDEAAKVLDRFARVFGQTYRRYRDLQKAEAQAREAQIEAALERVRAKAMAMHSSEDLGLTVDTFFSELKGLNVSPHRCGVGIVNGVTRVVRIQAIDTNQNQEIKKIVGDLKLAGHPVLDKIFESWQLQEEYFPVLRGKEIAGYYKVMNPQVAFHDFADDEVQYGYYFYFKEGGVYAWTDNELQGQDIQIFRRYTSVLSLTYRRYLDLKDAESQAREAIKQSSLDRVRGKIASMRSPEDLQHITPLIWSELEILQVPFIRCGVFIIDETKSNVQVYLTTPDGKPIGALNLPINANELTLNTVKHWRKEKVYTQHWNKEDFVSWMQSMISLGQVQTPEKYQGYTKPPESLDLHFIPFKQGMLYVGNNKPLLPEKIELVKTLAEAFSIAYARYEDFVHLEEAKNRVEKTLNELKSAQSQLIHSEKMASLGELTAGIAHEIQNPLNFVNNFSEVSVDLLSEMDEEIESGNNEEVKEISTDLKQNLEKISHHGKRASSIVKGMLEHSRAGDGHKEPTDINALADEYLRLAYHGLRAKDKSFNADFKTDLDDSLPKIKVVPQDIGRVLLNLINNAFYAVSSKASAKEVVNYKPLVMVSTKKKDGHIEIRVKDNGNGIPSNMLDKIFQPFFTTKPSGEGTGLGLSLSFDIITKGHGGEMKVETKEKKGTEFIILLPENK